MQTRKCVYCGAVQEYSAHQCFSCGGLVKQSSAQEPKSKNNKIIFGILLVAIALVMAFGFFSYKNPTPSVTIAPTTAVSLPAPPLQTYPTEALATAITDTPAPNMAHYLTKAKFSQANAELSVIKMLVVEHYHMTGQYPGSLSELGFNEKSFDTGEYIQAIQFSKKGAIQATLMESIFGEDKILILTPKFTMGGMNMHWKCTSNLEKRILMGICDPITVDKTILNTPYL